MREKIGNIQYLLLNYWRDCFVCLHYAGNFSVYVDLRPGQYTAPGTERDRARKRTAEPRCQNIWDGKYNMFYNVLNYVHSSNLSEIMSRINENAEASRDYSNIRDINAFFRGRKLCRCGYFRCHSSVTREGTVFSYKQ